MQNRGMPSVHGCAGSCCIQSLRANLGVCTISRFLGALYTSTAKDCFSRAVAVFTTPLRSGLQKDSLETATNRLSLEKNMPFFSFAQREYRQKRPGVFIKAITGSAAQLCMIKLLPGQMSDHHHAEEQIGYVLSGQAVVKIGNEEKELGPGEGYLVPTGVHHEFRVLGGDALEYLEIFCPPKRENADIFDLRGNGDAHGEG